MLVVSCLKWKMILDLEATPFVDKMEKALGRVWRLQKPGPKKKTDRYI